jgi:flagellar motor switch protein FliN/FliY
MTNSTDSTTPSSGNEQPATEQPQPNVAASNQTNPAQNAAQQPVEEKPIEMKQPDDAQKTGNTPFDPNKLGILNDVSIVLTIEVGRAQIKIRDLLGLSKGSIVELNKSAGDPVDIYANGKLISTGSIITANGKYCVRLTSIPENSKIGIDQNGQ